MFVDTDIELLILRRYTSPYRAYIARARSVNYEGCHAPLLPK